MRRTVPDQLRLVPTPILHAHAAELRKMSAVLDAMPEAAERVHAELARRGNRAIDTTTGREGMTAEQVLRAFIVKQMNGYSYQELAFHLADSSTYRAFCRFGIDEKAPTKSRLQKNIKRVGADTWAAINTKLVLYAAANGVESGKKVRTDSTVVESNIHAPTDSSLLWDCVRVLVRLQTNARNDFALAFHDHSRRAKRRAMGILNARSTEQRLPLYRDLLKVTHKTVKSAQRIADELEQAEPADLPAMLRAGALAQEVRHYVALANRVISQTERRVLRGESVPAADKLVSIFEPHADILVKDRRETLYGHKVFLTAGASGLVTDIIIGDGNPADATLAVEMVDRQRKIYGRVPRQVSFDGGFTSRAQQQAAKAAAGIAAMAR